MNTCSTRQIDDRNYALEDMNNATKNGRLETLAGIDHAIVELTDVRDDDRYGPAPTASPVENFAHPNIREIAAVCIELLTELRKNPTALKSAVVAYGISQYIEVSRF